MWLAQQQQQQASQQPAARAVVAVQKGGGLVASSYIVREYTTGRLGCQPPELIFVEFSAPPRRYAAILVVPGASEGAPWRERGVTCGFGGSRGPWPSCGARERRWQVLTPRLRDAGLLPDDPEMLAAILATVPE